MAANEPAGQASSQPRFRQDGYDSVLLCSACGGEYLHHSKVEVFERAEDEQTGLHVTAGVGPPTVDRDMARNPSSRRHGLLINFWCEYCSAITILSIAQHKGITCLETATTRDPNPNPEDEPQ